MTNDTRSPEEIEREIEDRRSNLTSNIEELQDKFSIDTLVRQIGDQFREHGGDMSRSIANQIKANPMPLALTGIGLAWLMMGGTNRPPARRVHDDDYGEEYGDRFHGGAGRGYSRASAAEARRYPSATSRDYAQAAPSWADEDDHGPGLGEKVASGAETARWKAADGAQSVRDGVADAGSAIGDAAASAKSTLTQRAQSARDSLAAAGGRIAEGTEDLTEEGRQRVIAARAKAVEMRRAAGRSLGEGADAVGDFFDRQPLVAGALALAVGAAIGGALPRSRAEDDLMGAQSDDLFREAERIFEEEKSKATAVAASVRREAEDIAAETRADLDSGAPGDQSAVEAIGEKARDAAERLADKAKSEADQQGLGKPKA